MIYLAKHFRNKKELKAAIKEGERVITLTGGENGEHLIAGLSVAKQLCWSALATIKDGVVVDVK